LRLWLWAERAALDPEIQNLEISNLEISNPEISILGSSCLWKWNGAFAGIQSENSATCFELQPVRYSNGFRNRLLTDFDYLAVSKGNGRISQLLNAANACYFEEDNSIGRLYPGGCLPTPQ
jgi:hypothetical protein